MEAKKKEDVKDQDVCDYNDEKERTNHLISLLTLDYLPFPKDVARIIANYAILLNVNFEPQFLKVWKEICNKPRWWGGLPIIRASNPLSITVSKWTIETKDSAEWTAGLYHAETKTILELYSAGYTYEEQILLDGCTTTLERFDTAGSFITFIVNLSESTVFVQSGTTVPGLPIQPPQLIWSDVLDLPEFVPFYRLGIHPKSSKKVSVA